LRLHLKVNEVREASPAEIEAGTVGAGALDLSLAMPTPDRLQ
jgi:hypothetical protein